MTKQIKAVLKPFYKGDPGVPTKVLDRFGSLVLITSTSGVAVGDVAFVSDTGAAFERAADDAVDAHLDYSGSGGVKWYEAGPQFSTRACAVAAHDRNVAAGRSVPGGTVWSWLDNFIVFMSADHPLYGTDPIADLAGWAQFSITSAEIEAAEAAAEAAQAAAETAQTGAETAETNAETARDLAETYAGVDHRAATWTALAAISGTAGDVGYVGPEDTGTHTDPVAGGTVDNEGVYVWDADGLGSAQAERVASTGLAGFTAALKSGMLNTSAPTVSTFTTMTAVHTNRIEFTETAGSGTQRAYWDLDKTYTAGEKIIAYLKAADNGGSDVPVGIGLYNGTSFRVGENTAVSDGQFYRYELTVPVGQTANRVAVYTIDASAADYTATVYAVRAADEWAFFSDGSVLGPLAKELLDLRSVDYSDYAPEGTAPLGPVDITGLLRAWDANDLLTTVAGTVKRWDSQDETLSLKMNALATRPWVNTDGGVYFNDTRYMAAELPIQYVREIGIPPSSIAPNTDGGYTITGMDRNIRGHWVTACDGRTDSLDTTYSPSIVILQPDASTVYDEIALSGTFAGIETVQGVACDTSDDTIWFADAANTKVQHINYSGVDQGDGISLTYAPNGVAYDAANDRLIIGRASGATIEIRSAVDGTLVSSFDAFTSTNDHLHYDGEYLWLTEGGNSALGNLWVYTTTGKIVAKYGAVPELIAVEGIWRDAEAGKIYVAVDANFHNSALSDRGAILEYDITAPPSGIAPSTLLWSGLLRRTSTTGGKVLWAFGDPIGGASGNYGWSLYWNNASNTLRFITTEAGTLKEVRWTIDAVTDDVILSLEVTDETSVNLYLNGNSTAETPASTVGDWTDYPFGFSAADGYLCGEPDGGSAGRQVVYGIILGDDLSEREKAEGFLAHRWSRTDLLASGHTYKATAP